MIEITEQPLDVAGAQSLINDAKCGGQVLFVGTTRRWTNLSDGREVETSHLIYEAYREMALAQMQKIAAAAQKRWPVKQVCLVHRIGRVDPEQPSVIVAVSTPHRGEAFDAARWCIDEIKHDVAIWKQEHYVQNGSEWIHPTSGSCNCNHDDSRTRPSSEHA